MNFSHFEDLCLKLYTSSNYEEKNNSQKELMQICSSIEFIPNCQYNLFI